MRAQVWAVFFDPGSFSEDLYHCGLALVDPDSQNRIKKFYRREDACRCLVGQLMPRMLLKERGVAYPVMSFSSTKEGKPYIATNVQPPIGYNISHDNGLIVMAYAPGRHGGPAYQIGVDIMKVELPAHESFVRFVQIVGSQMTPLEQRTLFEGVSEQDGLRRFFWIWTLKEAYSKALGVGLGFDFRRIEYNIPENVVKVDNTIPKGWQFSRFELLDDVDLYQGVVAEFIGGDEITFLSQHPAELLMRYRADTFVQRAVQALR